MASEKIVKAKSFSELQDILYGEVTAEEMEEMGLGIIKPTRIDAPSVLVPLYPPEARKRLIDHFKRKKKELKNEGYLFIAKIVRVIVPHVALGTAGIITTWLTDTGDRYLGHLKGQRIEVPIGKGPVMAAFYPQYSIPLLDTGSDAAEGGRTFGLMSTYAGIDMQPGNSPFSAFDLWLPEYSNKPQYYKTRECELHPIEMSNIKRAFNKILGREQFALAAMSNDNAEEEKLTVEPDKSRVKLTLDAPPVRDKDGRVTAKVRSHKKAEKKGASPSTNVGQTSSRFADVKPTFGEYAESVYDTETASVVG